jgi:hypothetical protein
VCDIAASSISPPPGHNGRTGNCRLSNGYSARRSLAEMQVAAYEKLAEGLAELIARQDRRPTCSPTAVPSTNGSSRTAIRSRRSNQAHEAT